MSNALPPLNALRAFEAAARHRNFARAALELNVTPGALSHQVRGLEALLGISLFERHARGVSLTAHGRMLYPGLLSAFGQMRDAVDALRASTRHGVLVVSAPPGFTSKWLAPRLYRFAQAHAEIELRIASSASYAKFSTDGVDLAIRNIPDHQAPDPALRCEKLIDDEMVVVCSPKLLAKMGRRRDLRKAPLIHDDQLAGRPEVPTWADWFRAAGRAPVEPGRGLRFSSAEHAIEAAVQSAGLLLTHAILARDELVSGRLVMPFDVAVPAGRGYYLVQPNARPPRPGVDAFRDWLLAEIAGMSARWPRTSSAQSTH